MIVQWSPAAVASARRFIHDQAAMRAIGAAVAALADDPNPPEAFVRGDYRRLKVGDYRVAYIVEGEVITVERVDQVAG